MSDFGFGSPSTRFSHSCSSSWTVSAFVAFGRFPWPFFAKSSCFSLQDLSALDKFSVLRYGYFAVIFLEVSVEGS